MASGTRGYSSYRGRGRKGKIFLAILLILIILGSMTPTVISTLTCLGAKGLPALSKPPETRMW